jgi:4-aminobutyrate aminotransferase-like enzyme
LLSDLLNKYPLILNNHYGEGLIASLIFNDYSKHTKSELASQVSEKCMQKGLLVVHTGRESIKLGPPLIITDEAMLEAVQIIDESNNEIILHD